MHDLARRSATEASPANKRADSESDQEPKTLVRHRNPPALAGLATLAVQRSLEVGASNDPSELAADQVAHDVVAALRRRAQADADEGFGADVVAEAAGIAPVARAAASPATSAGGPATPIVHELIARARSTGQPLPAKVRSDFEQAMGADLGAVRVHTGPDAAAGSRSIGALAFTSGSHVFFKDGMPDTSGPEGQALLAHELAHTVQQRGVVDGAVSRLVDGGAEIGLKDINDPATTEAQLTRWQESLEWDEDELAEAIKGRLDAIGTGRKHAADQDAAKKAEKAAEAADRASAQERANLRLETETGAGGALANYVESIDRTLRAELKDTSIKAPVWSGNFFKAAELVAPGVPVQEVLDALIGNEVALETFICANGGLGQAKAATPTTVAQAVQVADAWTSLADRLTAKADLNKICAQLTAGRLRAFGRVYRKATLTSTAGMTYEFARLEGKRKRATAQLHLHPGKKNDLNNAGLKNGKDGARVTLSAGEYQAIMKAVGS